MNTGSSFAGREGDIPDVQLKVSLWLRLSLSESLYWFKCLLGIGVHLLAELCGYCVVLGLLFWRLYGFLEASCVRRRYSAYVQYKFNFI